MMTHVMNKLDDNASFEIGEDGHVYLMQGKIRTLQLPVFGCRCYLDPYDNTCGIFEVSTSLYSPVLKTYFSFDNESPNWDDIYQGIMRYRGNSSIIFDLRIEKNIKLFCKQTYLSSIKAASTWKNNIIDDDACFERDSNGHIWLMNNGEQWLDIGNFRCSCSINPLRKGSGVFVVEESEHKNDVVADFGFTVFENGKEPDFNHILMAIVGYAGDKNTNAAIKIFCKQLYLKTMKTASCTDEEK